MANEVMTAPLAIIKVKGQAIGKMKGIRVNDNFQRGSVQGLGQIHKDEMPILSWAGTVTCDFYNVDFKKSAIPNAINREVQSVKEFTDNLTLQEEGVTIEIYKTVAKSGQPKVGTIQSELKIYAIISGCFIDGESWDITEASISGRNQSFQFNSPIIYPK